MLFRSQEGEEILHKEYKDDMTVDQGLKLAIKTLQAVLKENFSIDRVDCVMIKSPKKQFTRVPKQKISQAFGELKDGKKK